MWFPISEGRARTAGQHLGHKTASTGAALYEGASNHALGWHGLGIVFDRPNLFDEFFGSTEAASESK
jgi:hypothetical protein